jgi:predicted aconitase with swiveling domain
MLEAVMEQVKILKGIARSKGRASGEALVSEMRFGWGFNVVSNDGGIIGAYENPLNGQCVKGKIMVYPTVSGTTLGSVGLYYKCQVSKVGPSGLICRKVHDIDIAGAIAGEIPSVDDLDGDPIQDIRSGDWIDIRADEVGKEATVTITRRALS